MQFINETPFYKIIRITGPTHNFLGLELSENPTGTAPVLEDLNTDIQKTQLNTEELFNCVMEGVRLARCEFNQDFYVTRIQYISSDSLPIKIYSYLSFEIIRRVQSK